MKENRTVDSASVKEASAWRRIVQKYETPEVFRSAWQLVNTLVPYIFLWWLMFLSLDVSYWLTLALSLPAAGFLVRIFVINHDCGHRSFFKRVGTNNLWGSLTGVADWNQGVLPCAGANRLLCCGCRRLAVLRPAPV